MPLTAPGRCGTIFVMAAIVTGSAAAQSCLCGTAADEFVAGRAGLAREWVVQVPFDSAGWKLEHVVVGDGLVVAQGGDGTVAAITAASAPGSPRPGTVAWSRHIGGAPAPVERAGVGSATVAVARGRALTLIDASSGRLLREEPLRTVASAAAVPAGDWVYAPLDAGGIGRFPLNPWGPPPAAAQAGGGRPAERPSEVAGGPRPGARLETIEVGSEGEVDFPPLAYQGGVLWCTTNGRIGALAPTRTSSGRLDFDLGSPPSGPPVVYDGDVFVATRAGDVARLARSPRGLSANSGVVLDDAGQEIAFTGWHALLDTEPEGGPVVGGGVVVLSLGPSGMTAFDAATGGLLWRSPAAGRPLAITGDRVWSLESTGFLVARDLATGAYRDRLCLGCFTLPVVNTVSDRLVLASPGGLVVSLAPRRTVPATPPVPEPPPAEPAAARP